MREILFRGQTRRKGEKVRLDGTPVESNWVYGGVAQSIPDRDFSIIYQIDPEIHKFPVYADTIGQYTGLTDKNGNKVFEGDILSAHFDDFFPDSESILLVENNGYAFTLKCKCCDPEIIDNSDIPYFKDNFEIIGNIHDNPELLEGE